MGGDFKRSQSALGRPNQPSQCRNQCKCSVPLHEGKTLAASAPMDGDEPTGEQNHVILWLTVLSTLGNEKE